MDNTIIIKKSRLNKVMKLGRVEVKLIRSYGIYFLASNESMLGGNSAEDKHGYLYTWQEATDSPSVKYVYFRGITGSIMAETKIIKKRKAYCEARGIYPAARKIKEYRRELRKLKPDIMASRKIVQCCYSGVYLYDNSGIETFDGIAHESERENLVQCIENRCWIHKDNAIELEDGSFIHESYKHLLRECDDCGTLHLEGDMYRINGRDLCRSCYNEYESCSSCDEMCHRDDLSHHHLGGLCPDCSRSVSTCEECGDEFLDVDEEYICPDCKGNAIKDYSTKFEDLPDYGNALMFGVEMEFEVDQDDNRNSVARDFKEELGDSVMIKEDGSIDYGFEVVTRPLSMEDAVKTCATICECSQNNCYERPTTGVHIHISRAALSEIQICKMISIFGEIEEDIEKIAGRNSSSWARISKKKFSEIRKEGYDEFMKKEKEERYRAINLRNEHTVEFRVFAGTMNENTVEAYILFVAAIVIASKRISGADIDNGLTSEKVFSYVSKNKRYNNLRTYLSNVGVKF